MLDRARQRIRTWSQRIVRRPEPWLVSLGFVVLVLWLYRTVWWPPAGKPPQWFGWDCIESYWSDLAYTANAVGHGEAPLWNPYDRGGYAFAADPTVGLYYPLNWLFVAPSAIAGEMPGWVMQLKALLHHMLGGALLYAFLRTRGLRWPAAMVGGAVFVLSVPMFIHKASALWWNMIWAPLIWIVTDAALERAREPGWWRRAAALAGAVALSGSASAPPAFFYTLIPCLAYGGLRLAHRVRDAHRAKELRPELIAQGRVIGLAAVATLGLLAIVVMPGLDVAAESATRGATRDLAYALNTALPPGPTLTGAITPAFGMVDVYLGLLVLLGTIVALAVRPTADRGTPILFAGVALFALLLAFGADGHLLPWLVKHVPGFGLFREPNRYKAITAMALAVVTAYGISSLVSDDPAVRRRARLVLATGAAVLAIAIGIIAATKSFKRPPWVPGVWVSFVALGVIAGCGVGASLVPARWRPLLLTGALLTHYLEVTSFGHGFVPLRENAVDDQEDRKYLVGLGDVEREWRVYDEFVMEQRPGSRLRVRDFRGYPSGDPLDDARYADVRGRLRKDPELLAAYNVRWVLWGPHHRNGLSKNHVSKRPDLASPARFKQLDAKRWEVVDPAPLVAWYGAVRLAPARRAALDAVAAQEKQVGGRTRAIIEADDQPRGAAGEIAALAAVAAPPAPVAGRVVSYAANEVVVEIDAPAAGVVVLNEKLLRGWAVEVDGADATAFRANYMLRATMVTAGRHRIAWTYHPPKLRFLFTAYVAALGLLVAAAVSALRSRRRSRKASTQAPRNASTDTTASTT